jgi:hypothetical protein
MIDQLLETLHSHEKNAIQVIKIFIEVYTPMNSGEGDGLFSGMERYQMLAERLPQAAVSSQNLFIFWSQLRRKMKVGLPPQKTTEKLLQIWVLPDQLAILNSIVNQGNELMQIALALYREEVKSRKEKYESDKREELFVNGQVGF